ncbi:MAG: LacI family transcriptional regulator [Planctomycetes bacterium]|nr:LacI family transcriptional regulator [Planctomycetota bacterium]
MNNGPVRKTTLKDVARLCDVSPMTVSKMLNGKGGVSKETSKRIWKAIRQLNYTPNLVAKSLRVNKTRTFGVVTSDSSELLFPKMIKGIVDAAAAADYSVIIANTNQSQERESDAIRVLLNKRIDGLLLGAPFIVDESRVEEIAGFGIPVVLLMRSTPLPVDFVASDNFRGGYDLLSYMVTHGDPTLFFLALPRDHHNGEERIEGYRQAARDHNVPFSEEAVLRVKPEVSHGYRAMRHLIDRGVRRGAIICGCDVIAVGAIQAALDAGLSVPGDLRICGYDDIEMLDYLNVPLTTMRQKVYEMGQEGIRLLLERMNTPAAPPVQMRLPCDLVVRKSS